jgi:hypothetical protein
MTNEELLKENGWEIECQSPFEIRHEDGSFASMNAAYSVVEELRLSAVMSSVLLIKDAYKAELIDKDTFATKMLDVLEKHYS